MSHPPLIFNVYKWYPYRGYYSRGGVNPNHEQGSADSDRKSGKRPGPPVFHTGISSLLTTCCENAELQV